MGITWPSIPNNVESHASFNAAADTAYKELNDKLYDEYNAQDKSQFITDFQDRANFLDMAISARGLFQYYFLNIIHGGTGVMNISFPGEDWDNSYSFEWSTPKKKEILQNLGCDALRDDMCNTWNTAIIQSGKINPDIKNSLFRLALCSSYYRDLEGREPFVWGSDGSLTMNDRYNFTDFQDFAPAGGGPLKSRLTAIAGAIGGIIGEVNNNTLQDRADSFWNWVRKPEHTDYNEDPYFYWRKEGTNYASIIVSMTRDSNGTVTVVTSSPHGIDGTQGGGIRISSGNVNGWDDRTGAKQPNNGNAWHNPNGVDVTVVDANTFTYVDNGGSAGDEGGTTATALGTSTLVQSIDGNFVSSNGIEIYKMKRWGKSRHMYTSDKFTVTDLLTYNPKLLFDAIARGLVPYSALPNYLAQGAPASSPLPETTAGGPHAPDKQSLPSLVNNWTVGAGGNYPKPWMSASQKITNGNYTWVGAYAKLLGLSNHAYGEDNKRFTCTEDSSQASDTPGSGLYTNDNGAFKGKGSYGRIGLIQTGQYAGQWGYFPQDWHDQDQGTYNGAFWSARFDPPLPDDLVWKDPDKWWASVSKKKIQVWFGNVNVQVEVAMANPDFDDADYFKGENLSSYPDFSLNVTMLSVMVATAALARWL